MAITKTPDGCKSFVYRRKGYSKQSIAAFGLRLTSHGVTKRRKNLPKFAQRT